MRTNVSNGEYDRLAIRADLTIVTSAQRSMPTIEGMAAVFNVLGEPIMGLPEFRVRMLPGVFKRSLDRGDDVRALVDHESAKIIGRRSAKTLEIEENADGLKVKIKPPGTTAGKDVVESIKRGDLTGMSIGFITREDRAVTETISFVGSDGETQETSIEVHEILEVDLFEVSIVTWPVFPSTNVTTQSAGSYRMAVYRRRIQQNAQTLDRVRAGT